MGKVYTKNEIKMKLLSIFSDHPIEKAILFGSYARGNPTGLSDIDIVIDSNGRIRGIDFFNKVAYTINVRKPMNSWKAVIYYGISKNHIKGTDNNTYSN